MASHGVDYVWEKLSIALDHLASSDYSLRQRVGQAWVNVITRLSSDDFPPAQRAIFDAVKTACHRVQDDQRGSVVASVEAMETEEVEKLAKQLVDLFAWSFRQIPAELAEAVTSLLDE